MTDTTNEPDVPPSVEASDSAETAEPTEPVGGGEGESADEVAQQRPRSRYALGSASNMVRSLFVVFVMLAGLVLLVPRGDMLRAVIDPAPVAAAAVAETGVPFTAPQDLPDGWTATSARFGELGDAEQVWQSVWTTPSGGSIALKEAVDAGDDWVRRITTDAAVSGSVELAGQSWEQRVDERGQLHLVRNTDTDQGVLTTVVSATGGLAELEVFVPALRAVTVLD